MNIKKKAVEHVSFNCSTNFEKIMLPSVEEETTPMMLQELSYLDNTRSDQSESCIVPMPV